MQVLADVDLMRRPPSRSSPLDRNRTRGFWVSVSTVGDNSHLGGSPSRQPLEAGGFPCSGQVMGVGTTPTDVRKPSMIFQFESDAGVHGRQRWDADLSSVREAQVQAIRTLGELLSEDGSQFWAAEEVTMTVSDETGLLLFSLDLSAVKAPALHLPHPQGR